MPNMTNLPQPRIQDLTIGCNVAGNYILKTAHTRICRTGDPFLCGYLSDVSGDVNFILFGYTGSISEADAGKVVWMDGLVKDYQGTKQVHLNKLSLPEDGAVSNLDSLVPYAPMDMCTAQSIIYSHMNHYLRDPDYRKLCTELLSDVSPQFWTCPAAMTVHHAYIGGLAMHTANMMTVAGKLINHYSSFYNIDSSLLMAGTLFHDLGKLWEFQRSDLGLVIAYSAESQGKNHSIIGAEEMEKKAAALNLPSDKVEKLKHLILSHHGSLNLGAPELPQCVEAELLSLIDSIDTKLEIYQSSKIIVSSSLEKSMPFPAA